jgi:hypothetical protein
MWHEEQEKKRVRPFYVPVEKLTIKQCSELLDMAVKCGAVARDTIYGINHLYYYDGEVEFHAAKYIGVDTLLMTNVQKTYHDLEHRVPFSYEEAVEYLMGCIESGEYEDFTQELTEEEKASWWSYGEEPERYKLIDPEQIEHKKQEAISPLWSPNKSEYKVWSDILKQKFNKTFVPDYDVGVLEKVIIDLKELKETEKLSKPELRRMLGNGSYPKPTKKTENILSSFFDLSIESRVIGVKAMVANHISVEFWGWLEDEITKVRKYSSSVDDYKDLVEEANMRAGWDEDRKCIKQAGKYKRYHYTWY